MSIAIKNDFESHTADIKQYMAQLGQRARQAADVLSYAHPEIKNAALLNIASAIDKHRGRIRSENGVDMQAGKSAGLEEAMLDRLLLS
ncbi:MAG: gamma-glutamyl-phosphate reductase, partial [Gammaproteobacteria bacterium]|nr:gamma-glutamyl-phosphate reductase [Gammaproteobacteria bacterium]